MSFSLKNGLLATALKTKTAAVTMVAAALTTATGCSRLDLALRWADTFVMSSVTDYFDLNSEQKKAAKDEFNKALSDLRREEFPKLAEILRKIADLSEKNELKAPAIEGFLKEMTAGFTVALQRFEPMAQKIVADQAATGFKLFDEEFQKKYEKDLKKAQDPTQARAQWKDRADSMVDESIEYLTEAQTQMLKSWQTQNNPPKLLQVESRKTVFEKFKLARDNEESRKNFIKLFFSDWISIQTPAFQTARAEYQAKTHALMISILTQLTEEQRKNLTKNFRARAKEFDNLAGD